MLSLPHVAHVPLAVLLGAVVWLAACAPNQTSSAVTTAPEASPTIEPQRSQLSYGMVTSRVKKGETTQEEIIHLFGAPNITTINSDGEESWVYEVVSSSLTTREHDTGSIRARNFSVFFGLGFFGDGSADGEREGTSYTERSVRTLTVIIKFDDDKRVREYSARASYF